MLPHMHLSRGSSLIRNSWSRDTRPHMHTSTRFVLDLERKPTTLRERPRLLWPQAVIALGSGLRRIPDEYPEELSKGIPIHVCKGRELGSSGLRRRKTRFISVGATQGQDAFMLSIKYRMAVRPLLAKNKRFK